MLPGLKIIKTIQATDRFDAYEAEFEGQKVFAKKAKADKPAQLLACVPRNSEVVNKLGTKSDVIKFRAPEICKQEGEWLITEWIDGQPLGDCLDKEKDFIAGVMADFFIAFDNEPVDDKGFRQIFIKTGLANRMQERLPDNLSTGQKSTLAEAKKLFDKIHGSLVPALQDADIKPDHVFKDQKEQDSYILVDSEHLSNQWPRFFDLGNNFVKFWIRGQKEFSNLLLKTFLAKSEISEEIVFQPLLGTMIVRGIALHWEVDYDPGAEQYNIPRAQKMLKICLKAKTLDDLLILPKKLD
ncbi:hypothetical protein HYS84_01875 [Candidatus Saccharibacteria bacterium]|nr:hypothetical protein [Candidatus Saccharibacteria bacterium]